MEFQPTITLADGTILNGTSGLNEIAGDLWIWLTDTGLKEAFDLFWDAEKTTVMKAQATELDELTYEGFTQLVLIRIDGNLVSIRMKRGEVNGAD